MLARTIIAAALSCAQLGAQSPPPFSVDVGGFYQALDNGYSDWRGIDLRLAYRGVRFSPFGGLSTQSRREGSQNNFGVGSYYTINKHAYAIAGFSTAFGGTTVLYPRFRWDASLFGDTGLPGLVMGVGYTHVSFGPGSSGEIVSAGPILYHGPLILSGSLRLNHDGVGGANSGSGEIGGQYGAQGKQWIGGRFGAGKEAYQLLSATPFDVQFTDIGGSVFYQRWLTTNTAATVRVDYEHKLTAYHRRGVTLSYHVDF